MAWQNANMNQTAINQVGASTAIKTSPRGDMGAVVRSRSSAANKAENERNQAWSDLIRLLSDQQKSALLKVLEVEHRAIAWELYQTSYRIQHVDSLRAEMLAQMSVFTRLVHAIDPQGDVFFNP